MLYANRRQVNDIQDVFNHTVTTVERIHICCMIIVITIPLERQQSLTAEWLEQASQWYEITVMIWRS